jgi:5-(carboxyamino)imidazole ribonucleotide mutase
MSGHTLPTVAIVMGSDSDWPTLKAAAEVCAEFGVQTHIQVLSAHRTPVDMIEFGRIAHTRGFKVIIAGAGGAAHLPGMLASVTPLPVIGVPVQSKALQGLDSLLSIVQMPSGVPVATVAIGGGRNAGLLAIEILATGNEELLAKVIEYKNAIAVESREKTKNLS